MNKFTLVKFIVPVLAGGLLIACATIVDGGKTKPVSIDSPIMGKSFIIKDKSGKIVHQGVTPQIVNLPRSGEGWAEKQKYTVSLADGSATTGIESGATGWYIAGNILFGGLIGWLIVDPSTGAMYTLNPSEVSLQ